MDPRHYGKIGTTARAEPVNNQEVLFPNGYDRTKNSQDRPLVTVCDTAGLGDDDFTDEDFGFASNGPSEKVTVTIKFSSALDGIVTETDSRNTDDLESPNSKSTDFNEKKAKKENTLGKPVENVCSRGDRHTLPRDQVVSNVEVTSQVEDISNTHKKEGQEVKKPPENKTGINFNIKDSLYEEYERFVAPSERQCDTVVRPKSYTNSQSCDNDLDTSETRQKPHVKIVYDTTSPHREIVDRDEIVSPIFKTPIVKDTSSTSGDEAEDFLEYLKQLKGSNEDSIAEDIDSFDAGAEKCQNNLEQSNENKTDRSKCTKSFKNELVPILSVNATVVPLNDPVSTTGVIVISDDDEENDNGEHKSLLEFNFNSLKRTKQFSGGNGAICEETEVFSDSDLSTDNFLSVTSKRKKKKRKKTASKVIGSEKESDDSGSDESNDDGDDDDDQDEENENNSDKGSGDNNDDNDNNNDDDDDNRDDNDKKDDNSDSGSSNNGYDNEGCDENSRNSGHNSDGPEAESDSTQTDEYENESYYSPGMRSRSADISCLDNPDKNCPQELQNDEVDQDGTKEIYCSEDNDIFNDNVLTDNCEIQSSIESNNSHVQINNPHAQIPLSVTNITFAQNEENSSLDTLSTEHRDLSVTETDIPKVTESIQHNVNYNESKDSLIPKLCENSIDRKKTLVHDPFAEKACTGNDVSVYNMAEEILTNNTFCNSSGECSNGTANDTSVRPNTNTAVRDNLINMDHVVTERDNIANENPGSIDEDGTNCSIHDDQTHDDIKVVDLFQNVTAKDKINLTENETNLRSDTLCMKIDDDNDESDTNENANSRENDDNLQIVEVLSTCSSSLTAEDNEIIEILDYSEIVNSLNCKFQTIDTYVIEEYESVSDGEHSKMTTENSDDDNHESRPEESGFKAKVTEIPDETKQGVLAGDNNSSNKLSLTDLNSKDILNLSVFNKETSEEGSFCSMSESDGHCSELCLSSIPGQRGVSSPKHALNRETDDTNIFEISLFSDSSSSCKTDLDESDFESALDEEFWSKTAGSSLETSFSEDFSATETDTPDVKESMQHNVSHYESKDSLMPELCENSLDRKNIKTYELDIDSNLLEQDSDNIDSEYESVDDINASSENESDFVNEIKSRIPQSDCEASKENRETLQTTETPIGVQSDDNDRLMAGNQKQHCLQISQKDRLLETKLPENAIKTLQDRPGRTISYFAPFIKDIPAIKMIPGKTKHLEFICKLRKALLERVLPLESSGVTSDKSNNENSLDSIDSEHALQRTISDLKRKSKICVDGDQSRRIGVPGEIIKLGIGYYIFGAGDKLDLPIGPRLKTTNETDLCRDVSRPSIYFRGVPGIINNAYKMSSFSFPKLGVPTDTASRKILHACNRLATQLSPVEPRHDNKYDTMNIDMAVEDTDDTLSVSSADLTDMLMSSRDFLNSSRFDDAETGFLKLYKEIQEKPEDNGRLLVETLTGLADICIRRSRMCRSNPLEWQWLCMHAIALLQYTVEFCDSELENQLDNEATEWYQEQRQASELKCRPLEDAFTRALYNCLKHDANFFDPFQSFSLPNTPVSQTRKPNLFPLSSTMPQYLLVPGMSYRVTDQGLKKQSSDDSDVAVDWLAKFQFYCKDRLQTKDAKCVTEKVLKSTKSTDNDDTESLMSHGSHGSLDWDNSDLHGIEELELDITEKESPLTDYSLEYELASSETDNEGWDFFLHQRRNCDLQSVVQVVANEEEKCDVNERENSSIDKETQDIYQQEKSEKSRRKHHEPRDIVSPLHAHSISLTLARSFCRLADKLVQEEEYKKAEIVYEKILDIIDAIQDGTAGMLRFSARIMKNLGTVKSKQGKSSSGLVLLNKALNTYRDLQDEEANFEIAVALIELGNGYIVGKNHEDSVFDDVIIAICDFFEKDASDSSSTSTSSSVQSHISQMTSSLTSNTEDRNVEEAVMCYTEAISLLDCYEADEKQVDMFAKAIMRLGDCHFMQKDYDKALECYEKALGMFRTYNIFGKDSLMENAHVLCMLGVSSFMLHVYPRAASVFETALHMVRCAYGFKRTFLNGMLQSLSGITYYKMKNYHKCVSMCYQGYETYCELFGEGMPRLDKQKFWLVCQTLYVMGNSYNILSLQQKAMKYLSIARSLMKSSKSRERRQFMRVLQILGDCYFANYDYKTALQFYNEALEYGECESSISFDEVFDPNCASDEMTIHNHLVSKSAEAHLSMQQYQNAVHYLEQAHDMQEVMGEDIKGDLINTLHQLGHMHSVAGDVDKAIESYKECLEVFREIHKGELEPEMCTTLGNLAAICYVKACIADTLEEEDKMTRDADAYFHEALALENNAEVCVKYGNFLYSQCNFETAIVHFWNALRNDKNTADIVYRGLEKVTLPELLQDEVDTHDEICLPSSCLARYLLILSHKALHEIDEAEINLICLMEEALDYDVPLIHSLLGYAMMELMLFEEAAECFLTAAETEEEYQLACENYCICLLILLQKTLISGLENILDYVSKHNPNFCIEYPF